MRTFKTGGISTCFHCGKQLVRIRGGFSFAEIVDFDGHRLRVHKMCQEYALGDGYKLPPTLGERNGKSKADDAPAARQPVQGAKKPMEEVA